MEESNMLENCKDVLSVSDLCKLLPIGRSKVYELLKNGTIKSIRVGTRILILKEKVLEFLSS